MKLFIDGKRVEYSRALPIDGPSFRHGRWEKITVMGHTATGRYAPVSEHTLPFGFLDEGGSCYTGGHHYRATTRNCIICLDTGWMDNDNPNGAIVRCTCNPEFKKISAE